MQYFYSPSTNGFYLDLVHASRPEDASQITESAYQSLLRDQAEGKAIQPDSEGNPVAIIPVISLADAKTVKQGQLISNVNAFIERLPNGFPRYDVNLKLNLMVYGVGRSPATEVYAWIQAVQGAYFERKAQIAAASDLAALDAVDVGYDWFESRYGVGGSVLPDPDVSTADLQ